MGDPFNFESLRQQTPRYLELDSLKEALPVAGDASEHNAFLDVADVSMEDQPLSESEEEAGTDREVDPAPESSAESIKKQDSVNDANITRHSREELATPTNLDVNDEDHTAPVHKVLSPTQFGAHWALDSPNQAHNNGYGYEIRMPIPAPWHENLPYTLSTYLQLLFNVGVGLVGVWLVVVAKRDVSAIIRERSDEIALKASWCHQQYVVNNCSPDRVVPHLVESCLEFERCMDRDPANLRWLSIHASLLSEVLNALIEPLTIRTMISLAALASSIGLVVFMINYLFGFLRARTYFPASKAENHKQIHLSALPYRQSCEK